jgi:hypothetical protein
MAMGYQGLAQIAAFRDNVNPGFVPLLIEGASINLVLEPIYSEAIWGAGWYNAATNVNYADNAVRYEGSMDFQLQASREAWNLVRDWCIEYRALSRAARITPDASWVYYYGPSQASAADYKDLGTGGTGTILQTQGAGRMGLWSQGFSLNTSQGSFVSGSINAVALFREVIGPGNKTPLGLGAQWDDPFQQDSPDLRTYTNPGEVSYIDNRFGLSKPNNPLNPRQALYNNEPNFDPIPYWRTRAFIRKDDGAGNWTNVQTNNTDMETVEWSIDLTNNTQVLYTCRGVRGASAVLQGAIDATGSVTLYNQFGVPDPIFGLGTGSNDEFNPYFIAEDTEFVVEIVGTDGGSGNNLTLALPAVVIESDDYGIKGQNEVTNRTYSLKGLGGRELGNLDSNIAYTPDGYVGTNELSLPPLIMTEA